MQLTMERSVLCRATALAVAAALAVTAALAGVAGAAGASGFARTELPRRGAPSASSPGVVGTVVSVDSASSRFVIRTTTGTSITVDVTKATAYKVNGGASATFSALKQGESVAVIGTLSSGTDLAAVVVIGKATPGAGAGGFPGGFAGGTFGKVVSVDSSARSFELKPAKGAEVKVVVTRSTTYRDRADASAGFAQIKVGENVAVVGTTTKGVETARTVVVGFAGAGGFPGGFAGGTFGKVVSVDSSARSFELKPAKGAEVKVVVTRSTTYRDRADASAGFAQIKVGENVAVVGTTTKGVETARTVVVGLSGGFAGAPAG